MTEPVIETRTVDFRGRTLIIQKPNDAQIALMAREARLLERDGVEGGRKVAGAARMFDILEGMVVGEDDREWVTEEIVAGKVVLTDLTDFITAFRDEEEKPRVRRGRPPTKRR